MFVALARLQPAELVLPTIAHTFGIRLVGRWSVFEAFGRALRGRRMLLVLDDCEHLVAAAPLLIDLLGACPGLAILTTSRAPLHVSGEHLFRVLPLELPQLKPLFPRSTYWPRFPRCSCSSSAPRRCSPISS